MQLFMTLCLVSSLLAHRNAFSLAHPAPQKGTRALMLQRSPEDGGAGAGSAAAGIGSNGLVRLIGRLSDGSRFAIGSALATDGTVPFFAPLSGGSGLLVGWLHTPYLGANLLCITAASVANYLLGDRFVFRE